MQTGDTALHGAARQSDNPTVVQALLDVGADPTALDSERRTPWDMAQRNDAIKNSDAYWRLNDARFNGPQSR